MKGKLEQLINVHINEPQAGQLLTYNADEGDWRPETLTTDETVDQATATAYPSANPATAGSSQVASWFAKRINEVIGAANWWDAVPASLTTLWAKFSASTGHKHTGAVNDGPVLPAASITQGSGSGLDADAVDGLHASAFALASNVPAASGTTSSLTTSTSSNAGTSPSYSRGDHRHAFPAASTVVSYLASADGAGSGLDADLLDGQQASAFGIVNTALDDINTVDSPIINSTSDTIDGIGLTAAAGGVYLAIASFEIFANNGGTSVWGYLAKFNFESTFRVHYIPDGQRSIVSFAAVYSPSSTTTVAINLYYGGPAGAIVPADKGKLVLVRIA